LKKTTSSEFSSMSKEKPLQARHNESCRWPWRTATGVASSSSPTPSSFHIFVVVV
jgi:hypothetical protein